MNNCDCQNHDSNQNSSTSGFIFGLICGVIIGAVIAVIVYKNNKIEVFEKLEQKIKSFFEDLVPKNKPKKTTKSLPKKIITVSSSEKPEIKPVFIKPSKPTPKMFVKPKK